MTAKPAFEFLERPPRTGIVEAMRHGLNRASDYSYFHAWRGKPLPRIPPP